MVQALQVKQCLPPQMCTMWLVQTSSWMFKSESSTNRHSHRKDSTTCNDLTNKGVIQAGLQSPVFSNKQVIKTVLKTVFSRSKVICHTRAITYQQFTFFKSKRRHPNTNCQGKYHPRQTKFVQHHEEHLQEREKVWSTLAVYGKQTMKYGHLQFLEKPEGRQSIWVAGPSSSALGPSENLHCAKKKKKQMPRLQTGRQH